MDLASIRMITDDVEAIVQFYEHVTGTTAERHTPVFAEVILPSARLAIGHTDTARAFGTGSVRAADNHSVIIELRVADVDAEFARLGPVVDEWIQQPTTMPWGNRSILFRDPDGNLVNLFTPVTEAALTRLGA
jgi:catechol 2,3-dioxygenase-like lactoylglutathione lyase family enzyme